MTDLRKLAETIVHECRYSSYTSQSLESITERRLKELAAKYQEEIDRLQEGNFTATEFQNLCHNMRVDGQLVTPELIASFFNGCREYQDKLFGEAECTKLRSTLE